MNELESELERRTLTYTLWNQSVNKMENRGWHPVTFSYTNAGPQKIKEIKVILLPFFFYMVMMDFSPLYIFLLDILLIRWGQKVHCFCACFQLNRWHWWKYKLDWEKMSQQINVERFSLFWLCRCINLRSNCNSTNWKKKKKKKTLFVCL